MPTVPLVPTDRDACSPEALAWHDAWHESMVEQGYPHAVLQLEPLRFSYRWTWVHDNTQPGEHSRLGWEAAHRALLAAEPLRPVDVPESPALERFKSGEWTLPDLEVQP